VPLVWGGVFFSGVLCGRQEAGQRRARPAVTCATIYHPSHRVGHRGGAVLRVTGWPTPGARDTWRFPARVLRYVADDDAEFPEIPVRGDGALVSVPGPSPCPGDILSGRVEIRVPSTADLPGSFDYRQYLRGRDLTWTAVLEAPQPHEAEAWTRVLKDLVAPVRRHILGALGRLLPPGERDLAQAVLLGARSSSSRQASQPYADLGLAHLFAVSGLHVGILVGILLLPAKVLDLPPAVPLGLLIFLLPLYMILTGLPGSVVRAALLALVATGAAPAGRRSDALHLLGLLFWGTTVWYPGQVLDTGVRLSYLAAGGILFVVTRGTQIPLPRARAVKATVAALAVSLTAIWFTLPQAALSFGRLPLLAPVANLVAVPLFGLGVWGLVLSLVFDLVPGPWGGNLAALTWLLLRGLSGTVALGALKGAGYSLGLGPPGPGAILLWLGGTGMLSLALFNPRHGRVWILVALCLGLTTWQFQRSGRRLLGPPDHLNVHLFDVGQGDAILIRFPDGFTTLIDTAGRYGFRPGQTDGPLARQVLPFLARTGLKHLDLVILTHGHGDHTGGNPALSRQLAVGQWLCGGHSARSVNDSTKILRPGPLAGDILHTSGPFSLRLIHAPPDSGGPLHENDRSLIVALDHDGRGLAVFSGDLETHGETEFLAETSGGRPFQVLKAGHHGSNTSGSGPFLTALDPGLVLISCGVDNSYGHPNHGPYVVSGDTLPQLRTDLEGSIHLSWDARGRGRWSNHRRKGQLPPLP